MSKETYTETFRLEKRRPDFDTYFAVEERPIYTKRDLYTSKETYTETFRLVKRDLLTSMHTSKSKRDLYTPKET